MSYLIDRNTKMTLLERLYLPEIIRGMCITGLHFFRNLIHMDRRITIEYPEQEKRIPPGYRAEHRLMKREDGSIRCTACMLCATICPAGCIEIEAEEVADPSIEKRAKRYTINELRCVFCGFCVEACPCDAIRMDTGMFKNASFDRSSMIYHKELLLANHPDNSSPLSVALGGGA
ncbi:MAG: NADH-quinone oxidoreductase subunit I [Pseudomonadota bacterium]